MLGETLSVADFNLLPFYRWGGRVGLDMGGYPAWGAHAARMGERQSVQRVLTAEGVGLNDRLPLPEGVAAPKRD